MGAITSQNGTAPKRYLSAASQECSAITSQNGTAPKLDCLTNRVWRVRLPVRTALLQNHRVRPPGLAAVRLPVRTALLQNIAGISVTREPVRLPVRTALLQNCGEIAADIGRCDYQSERHCSKTSCVPPIRRSRAITSQNGTAPKRHQRKTQSDLVRLPVRTALLQNISGGTKHLIAVRLPVRTALLQNR